MRKIKIKTKFEIEYNPENCKYYFKNKGAQELFDKLLIASDNRCMYCGKNLYSIGAQMKELNLEDIFFNREHTVNKTQNGITYENLKHCKFNLAVSCQTCNNAKSKIINVDKELLEKLEEKNCPRECLIPCKEYLEVLKNFEQKNKIILQPLGLSGRHGYDIIYNIENLTFELNLEENHTDEEKIIINNHISKFLQRFEKKCLKDVILALKENEYGRKLPSKKDMDNQNRFLFVVGENFLDYLKNLNNLQREMIIRKIEKNLRTSSEGITYKEIIS